jgi:hypothetical protein
MLWWEGSDNRHRPQIIGPVGVSWPFQLAIPRLNDENLATCWASSEEPADHWVELRWLEPVTVSQVVLDWPLCWQRYWASQSYRLEIWNGTSWQMIEDIKGQREKACSRHSFAPVVISALRIVQPAGGGSKEYPNRLWLAEIEVYCVP